MKLGSYAWARQTGGRLSRMQALLHSLKTLAVVVAELPQRFGLARPRRFAAGADSLVIPDSRLAREAEEMVRECSGPSLYHHTLRSYCWGALIGNAEGVDYDPEMFYVCCLLHDLGLTEAFSFRLPQTHCFAVEGGFQAEDYLLGQSYDPRKSRQVAEAITLHLNPVVRPEDGPEAYLLRAGSGLDVVGARFAQLPRQDREWVLSRFPRGDFKNELLATMLAQQAQRRHDRLSALGRAGFRQAVRFAPFER